MIGHRTLGSQLSVLGLTPNQTLAAQATWWVDPINGKNSSDGKTQGTALNTRGEFYRRMAGVTLTQNVNVNITSDLKAGDTHVSTIYAPNPLSLTFTAVPAAALFSGIITGYTGANPAGNVVTQMTIAGLPVSWTASGLLGKLIRKRDKSIVACVVSDLGAKTAHISPPLNPTTLVGANFSIGDTVDVYADINLGTCVDSNVQGIAIWQGPFTATLWRTNGTSTVHYNCDGEFLCLAGSDGLVNTRSETVQAFASSSAINVYGGYLAFAASNGGGIGVRLTPSLRIAQVGEGGTIVFENQLGVACDAECVSSNANGSFLVDAGQIIVVSGHVYGAQTGTTNLATFSGRAGTLDLGPNAPAVTGGSGINFSLDGTTDLVANLPSKVAVDTKNNRAIGGYGQPYNVLEQTLFAQGVIAETIPRNIVLPVVPATGTCYFMQVTLKKGAIIGNCHVLSAVAPTGLTLAKIGLYDNAGNQLAKTADVSAAWSAAGTGLFQQPFIVPYTVTATGIYYLALITTGTTAPSLAGILGAAASRIGLTPGLPGHPIQFGSQAGVIDLPSPLTVAAGAAPGIWYIGVSP